MSKLEKDDFGILAICAIRYCHGRQTYMPDLVRNIVRPRLKELSDKDLNVMIEDCDFQERLNLYGDERKTGKWIDVACPNCGCKIHIEPEHKPAHWIVYEVANTEEEQPIAWQCPNCDEVVDCKYNFCPECGQEFEVNT